MEGNKDYLAISELISNLELQLKSVEDVQLRDFDKNRREIEEHFERCIHALEARQRSLLAHLETIAKQESPLLGQKTKILDALQSCNAMKETGALVYKTDHSIAEQIWQGANKLPIIEAPKLSSKVEIELPTFLLEEISNYGSISLKNSVNESCCTVTSPILSPADSTSENSARKAKVMRRAGSYIHIPNLTSFPTSPTFPPDFSVEISRAPQKIPSAPTPIYASKETFPTSPTFPPDFSVEISRVPQKVPSAPTPISASQEKALPVDRVLPKTPALTSLQPFTIVLVGNSKVGKTCISQRFTRNAFTTSYKTSIGIELESRNISKDGTQRSFQVWSPTGNTKSRKPILTCCKRAHGIICVYDITNVQSFLDLKGWIDDVHALTGDPAIPKIIVGNKSDLSDRRLVDVSTAKNFADRIGAMFFEASAKDSQNIDEIFFTLADQIIETFPWLKDQTAPPPSLRRFFNKLFVSS